MKTLRIILIVVASVAVILPQAFAGMEHHGGGHDMTMHHQHVMLNHALGMSLEGSNLVMLGQMGMAKGIDKITVEHGEKMMKNGRNLWNELMSGDVMMKMHKHGKSPMEDPLMKYTHQLAEAQIKVMDLLDKMPSAGYTGGPGMSMHHQHVMLNHALKMTLEGSNLIMLGQMGMAKGVDELTVEHGKSMIKHGRKLFDEIMSGPAMKEMHAKGVSPEKDKLMGYTHRLAEAELKVMEILKKMPPAM